MTTNPSREEVLALAAKFGDRTEDKRRRVSFKFDDHGIVAFADALSRPADRAGDGVAQLVAVEEVAVYVSRRGEEGVVTHCPPAGEYVTLADAKAFAAKIAADWLPDGAVWLAPVATDAPANPKLMQYAWGRSSLSSGQMAEAYQCIVSAAQECGQVYRLPTATPQQPASECNCMSLMADGTGPAHLADCPAATPAQSEDAGAVDWMRDKARSMRMAGVDEASVSEMAAYLDVFIRNECATQPARQEVVYREALERIANFDGDSLTPTRNSVKKSAIARAALAAAAGEK